MRTAEEILIEQFGERVKTSRHYTDMIKAMNKYRESWSVKKHGKGVKVLELDMCKDVTYDSSHGFVIQDMNDSVFFTMEECIKMLQFAYDVFDGEGQAIWKKRIKDILTP